MNTATYRAIAAKAEKALEWQKAAANWERAILHYPTIGPLADLDIKNMRVRRDSCLAMESNGNQTGEWK